MALETSMVIVEIKSARLTKDNVQQISDTTMGELEIEYDNLGNPIGLIGVFDHRFPIGCWVVQREDGSYKSMSQREYNNMMDKSRKWFRHYLSEL